MKTISITILVLILSLAALRQVYLRIKYKPGTGKLNFRRWDWVAAGRFPSEVINYQLRGIKYKHARIVKQKQVTIWLDGAYVDYTVEYWD